jgi:hypothetical protein
MSDLERERKELADDDAGSTASGQPWAKTSSGDAEAITTDATGGVAGGDPDVDGDGGGDKGDDPD